MRRTAGDESGFALIEILVAALILVIGIVGAMGGFIDSSKATQTAQRQDTASALATQAIEQVRNLPYASQAVDAAYPAPPTPPGPLGSISGSNFTTQDAQTEPLVAAVGTSGIDPVSYLDVETGVPQSSCATVASGHQCATIYRFVSWRKETCPTINLSTILGTAATPGSLRNQITTLSTTVTNLSTSIATDQRNPVTGSVAALLGGLLGSVTSTVNALDTSLSGVSTAIAPAQAALSGPLATLQTAIAALPAGSLTALDLCSLPNLNLDSLAALSTALTAAQAVLGSSSLSAALADANTELTAIENLNLVQIVNGLVTTINGALSTDTSTIITATTAINAAFASFVNEFGSVKSLSQIATDAVTNVQALATWITNNSAANGQQTKRITVAVVLNNANSEVGVRQPVWMSSVSTDSTTGLFL